MAVNNQDVFGIDSRVGGAWSLDGAVVIIDAGDGADGNPDNGGIGDLLIVTSIDITYARQSQKFSPLNQNRKYLALGESDGRIQLGLVIGPHAAIRKFLKQFSDPCTIKKNMIQVSPAGLRSGQGLCGKDFEEVWFKASGCLINSLNIRVQQTGGALTVVNAGIGMQFLSLEVGGTDAAAQP